MSALDFWRQKLVQLLHDPPAKDFFLQSGPGAHMALARELLEVTAGVPLRPVPPGPDRAAAGADRPVVSPPPRPTGVSPIDVDWLSHPVLTHPLASGARGHYAIHFGNLERPRRHAQAQTQHAAHEIDAKLAQLAIWNDEPALRAVCLQIWRRWPTIAPPDLAAPLWEHQPADSRTPDHSLWDYLRVTSALAFLGARSREGATMPWLVAFSLGPVQQFIAQSRTSSDLWTASMLLSDLIWHAMTAFVDCYGPEAIVYPDLRGNPRADLWLWEHRKEKGWKDALPAGANPCSYAGIFPNTFIALVPRGGGDGLDQRLEDIARQAKQRVQGRWTALAALAKQYFVDQAKDRRKALTAAEATAFERTWERQHKDVLFTAWSAVAWPERELEEGPTVHHDSWIPSEALAEYTTAGDVYAKTNRDLLRSERGVDYPLVHHALHVRHQLRKAEARSTEVLSEAGEKCTLCGLRQALGLPDGAESGHVDSQRAAVRRFWELFDRNSEGGAERLCAVCTMKRVLIRAGVDRSQNGGPHMAGLTAAWAGPETPIREVLDHDDQLRVPFPSTATVAAQAYLCAVAAHPALRDAVREVVRCCKSAELARTTFVRSLRSLAEATEVVEPIGQELLEYEAEMTVFPEAVASVERRVETRPDDNDGRNRHGALIEVEQLQALRTAVAKLRAAAAELEPHEVPAPGTQVAMITLDGDGVRKLLLGTAVGARWRDVIHPEAVQAMLGNEVTRAAGWPALLDRTRLMGPSTHAFVNRVLASFAHTIVPWVVEREFHGRLIYAGGDDVLALAPASEAIDIAARLAQLYSAGWVIDTRPDEEPWGWRRSGAPASQAPRAASRFAIVAPSDAAVSWPIPAEHTHAPVAQWIESGVPMNASRTAGRLLPMMGAGQTLSAGIAIGHYKTPLGALVKAAWEERDRAKGKRAEAPEGGPSTGGNAFSIRRFTRGGEKAWLRLSWGERDARPERALAGYRLAKRVIAAFRARTLPARTPYKLREVEEMVLAAWRTEAGAVPNVRALAEGLFATQVGASDDVMPAFEIWWSGLCGTLGIGDEVPRSATGSDLVRARGLGSEQGLSVCRFLATLGDTRAVSAEEAAEEEMP